LFLHRSLRVQQVQQGLEWVRQQVQVQQVQVQRVQVLQQQVLQVRKEKKRQRHLRLLQALRQQELSDRLQQQFFAEHRQQVKEFRYQLYRLKLQGAVHPSQRDRLQPLANA
jgi:hypothetical protein